MAEKKSKSCPSRKVCGNCRSPEGSANTPKLSACARCGLVVYCSRDCQKAHWKASHKQHCISKSERAPPRQSSSSLTHEDAAPRATAVAGKECSICLDSLSEASSCILSCGHEFHGACVAELRKFGIKQMCPLCRTPLPPGPEKLYEEAVLQFVSLHRLVKHGKASWSGKKHELDAVVISLRSAADQGFAEAQNFLGRISLHGEGVAQNDKEAIQWFMKAAERGHAEAQNYMGMRFKKGRGVPQSDAKALRWYRKAAEQGDADGQYHLGAMYIEGHGVAQSDAETVRWWRKAAEQGHKEAQFHLGTQIAEGRGVAQNDAEALRWFKKAADQGLPNALLNLGIAYKSGRGGVKPSDVEAARCLRKAANQGYARAQYFLGVLYKEGSGVAQSDKEAVKLWQQAAMQGDVDAQRQLGAIK